MIKRILSSVSKFFQERKSRKIAKKYHTLCLDKSVPDHNYYEESRDVDKLFYDIISTGFDKLIVSEYAITGTLLDGRNVYIWNNNLWFSWACFGMIGNVAWDKNSKTADQINNRIKAFTETKNSGFVGLFGGPSKRAKVLLKNYFLSIDKNFFYDKIDKSKIGSTKLEIDTKVFNRDLKLSNILSGA